MKLLSNEKESFEFCSCHILNWLTDKIHSLYLLTIKNRPTKPYCIGRNLLVLATGPSVKAYFENESVREQFKDYDLAAINFMLSKSEDLMHKYKPRFFVLLDSIYFLESARNDIPDWMREDCYKTFEALERIDWDCEIITYPLGEWRISNPHIRFIYLSIHKGQYNLVNHWFYKHNIMNAGVNNVIIGTLYFAITFGYKNVAMLGCPYRQISFEMKPDGMHLYYHMHYYDDDVWEDIFSFEEIQTNFKGGFDLYHKKRAIDNCKSFIGIAKYAKRMGTELVNYSDGSQITAIRQGELNVPPGTDLSYMDIKNYKFL